MKRDLKAKQDLPVGVEDRTSRTQGVGTLRAEAQNRKTWVYPRPRELTGVRLCGN